MDIQQALYELGVRDDTLTAEEKAFLDREGYLPLRGLLTMEQVEALRTRLAELTEAEGDQAGLEVHQEAGTDRLSDLINKGEMFQIVITHPRLLAGIAHVLGSDLKLSSLNSRAALPGQGLQHLHADWGRHEADEPFQVCNSIWLLDDFTEENGATRVVPGTHRGGKLPGDEMPDPSATHPNEALILGEAGDVVIFNSHTWHGGTLNRTDRPRRAMHGYFTRRALAQQLDQAKYLRRETWERLPMGARVVLGVDPDRFEKE